MKKKILLLGLLFLTIICTFVACGYIGRDDVLVSKAEINDNGELIIYYSDGTQQNLGEISAEKKDCEHDYADGICIKCGSYKPSIGLQYLLNYDCTYYTLIGIGTCNDANIVIPATYNKIPVKAISSEAFYGCESISNVTFDKDIKIESIGDSAFENCVNLTTVTFGENARIGSIGNYAFKGCSSLNGIDIPESVTSI